MDGRIVGGNATEIESYPYQLSLRRFNSHSCGASLLNESVAITAAHCTYRLSHKWLSVRAGSTYRNDGGVIVKVKKVIQNEMFKMSVIDYDMSLLILDPPLNLSDSIQPLNLPEVNDTLPIGETVTVTGWGTTAVSIFFLNSR